MPTPSKSPRTEALHVELYKWLAENLDKLKLSELIEHCLLKYGEHARTLEIELGEAVENLKTEKQYAGHKNDTANTFMLQVKKLQAENTSLHAQISNACVSLQRGDNIEIAAKAAQEHILKLQETINQF